MVSKGTIHHVLKFPSLFSRSYAKPGVLTHHCTVDRLMAPDGTQWNYLLFNTNKSC